VNSPRHRKSGLGNPPPTAGGPELYPNEIFGHTCSRSRARCPSQPNRAAVVWGNPLDRSPGLCIGDLEPPLLLKMGELVLRSNPAHTQTSAADDRKSSEAHFCQRSLLITAWSPGFDSCCRSSAYVLRLPDTAAVLSPQSVVFSTMGISSNPAS
jgi:hypothetical protein